MTNTSVRTSLIDTTHACLVLPINTKPFQTKYWTSGPKAGHALANVARSTVGSNFALLALDGPWWAGSIGWFLGGEPVGKVV